MSEEMLNEINMHMFDQELNINSYICLYGSDITGEADWAWNNDVDNIKKYFLYIFITSTLYKYYSDRKKEIIGLEIVTKLCNCLELNKGECTLEEWQFYDLWKKILNAKNFKILEKEISKMCKFLNNKGFDLTFVMYENPKKALPVALELDECVEEGDIMFGALLKKIIEDKGSFAVISNE